MMDTYFCSASAVNETQYCDIAESIPYDQTYYATQSYNAYYNHGRGLSAYMIQNWLHAHVHRTTLCISALLYYCFVIL